MDQIPNRSPGTKSRSAKCEKTVFGSILEAWRRARRYSQLELASETRISQRHLSFLESGRANPSREMVMQLALVLNVPLRERNQMLTAAGFAPLYPERSLNDPSMLAIRRAVETTLDHHEPFPALVIDRQWNVLMSNAAVGRLIGLMGPPAKVWEMVDPRGKHNLMRLCLHPSGLRPLLINWVETANVLLARLQAEVQANPANANLRALLTDLRGLPGMLNLVPAVPVEIPPVPVLSLDLRHGATKLSLFSMLCTFGTSLDLTADELRLEMLFPCDDATAHFLRGSPSQISNT